MQKRLQQVGQRALTRIAPPPSEMDAREHYLSIAPFSQEAHLVQHVSHEHAARRSAGDGDHAVAATRIAPVLDLEEGPGVAGEVRDEIAGEDGVGGEGRDQHGRRGLSGAFQQVVDVFGEFCFVHVAQHQVDTGYCRYGLRRHLCVAAGDHQPGFRIGSPHAADLVAAGAVGLAGDGAGVQHAYVGAVRPGHQLEASRREGLLHLRGLALVQLAAECAEGDPGGGRHEASPSRRPGCRDGRRSKAPGCPCCAAVCSRGSRRCLWFRDRSCRGHPPAPRPASR